MWTRAELNGENELTELNWKEMMKTELNLRLIWNWTELEVELTNKLNRWTELHFLNWTGKKWRELNWSWDWTWTELETLNWIEDSLNWWTMNWTDLNERNRAELRQTRWLEWTGTRWLNWTEVWISWKWAELKEINWIDNELNC